jgi:quercetin dioxygenase-like cupin family protein
MKITRNGTKPSAKGAASWFTGAVRIDSPFQAEEEGRSGGAIVTFEPGARTNWHTHPAGQTLVVLNGVGWTQCEGGPRTEIRAGDVVWWRPIKWTNTGEPPASNRPVEPPVTGQRWRSSRSATERNLTVGREPYALLGPWARRTSGDQCLYGLSIRCAVRRLRNVESR